MELFDSRDLQFAVNVHELKQDVDTDMKKLTTNQLLIIYALYTV